MLSGARIQQRLARQALALVLAGGRGSRLKQLTDRRAKPAVFFGGKFRHHRLHPVELPQFGGAADRGPDPVQGAQPVAPPADGLVVSAPGNERVSRSAAGAAAARRGDLVSRHRRRGVSELRYPAGRRPALLRGAWPATTSTRWIIRTCWPITSRGAPDCTVACVEVPFAEASDFGVMAVDEFDADRRFPGKAAPAAGDGRQARPGIGQHGRLCVHRRFSLCRTRARPPRPVDRATISARTSSRTWSAAGSPSPIHSRKAASRPRPRPIPIGAMSAPSTPIGRPISIWSCRCRRSTSTIPTGRSGPTSSNCRRPNSSSTTKTGAAWRSIRWFPAAASFRAPRSGAR